MTKNYKSINCLFASVVQFVNLNELILIKISAQSPLRDTMVRTSQTVIAAGSSHNLARLWLHQTRRETTDYQQAPKSQVR